MRFALLLVVSCTSSPAPAVAVPEGYRLDCHPLSAYPLQERWICSPVLDNEQSGGSDSAAELDAPH